MYTTVIASRIGDDHLAETVSSIAAQTLPASRVLVVCNPDEPIPEAWSRSLNAVWPTVEFLRSQGVGMVSALNHGIAATTTPYVAFLDSDDLWQPEKQELQIDALESTPSLDAVACLAANFRTRADGSRAVDDPIPATMFTCVTFRREVFDRYGLLDESSGHFTWLYRWWGRAQTAGIETGTVDYTGTLRRLHDDNSWIRERGFAHRELLAEVRRHVNRDST